MLHQMYYSVLLGQWSGLANGVFALGVDTIKVSAHTDSYAPNLDADAFWDDTSNEVSGTNYTTGGVAVTVTPSRSGGTVTFDAGNAVWLRSAAGFSNARKFVVYRSTGSGPTSRLFSVITADADLGNVNSDLVLSGA